MNEIKTFTILIREYLGYENHKPHYGKTLQLTVQTLLTQEELRDSLSEILKIPVRKVGRPQGE